MADDAPILVVGPAWVGDMVMAQSLFMTLKAQRPERAIDVLAPGWSLPLIARMGEVRAGIEMPLGHGDFDLKLRRRLGHALRGAILDGKGEPAPLRLNVPDGDATVARTFETGIGTGTRSVLSYTIPPGVYTRFTVWAGLHADFGASGHVSFDVAGNGRSLVRLEPVKGNTTAARVDVPLEGITELRLTVTSAGGDGSGNFAVWGDPRLVK